MLRWKSRPYPELSVILLYSFGKHYFLSSSNQVLEPRFRVQSDVIKSKVAVEWVLSSLLFPKNNGWKATIIQLVSHTIWQTAHIQMMYGNYYSCVNHKHNTLHLFNHMLLKDTILVTLTPESVGDKISSLQKDCVQPLTISWSS